MVKPIIDHMTTDKHRNCMNGAYKMTIPSLLKL